MGPPKACLEDSQGSWKTGKGAMEIQISTDVEKVWPKFGSLGQEPFCCAALKPSNPEPRESYSHHSRRTGQSEPLGNLDNQNRRSVLLVAMF